MKHDDSLMAVLYREVGLGIEDLAEDFGLSPSTVRRRLLEAGVEMRGRGRPRKPATPRLGGRAERWLATSRSKTSSS